MEMEKESRTKAVKPQLLSIPQDLVVDVLTNLPVKSLLRFRCVCKLWCSLIFDPHFIKSQANVNNNNNHPKYAITKSVIGCESLHIIDYKTSVRKFEFRDTSFCIKDFDQILGSCNGLLVIADFYKMKAVLWNPLTKEYKRVLNYPHEVSYYHSLSGLGFDSSTDEYKLIMANTACFQTYSFGTDSWTAVQVFPYSWITQLATLVNGTPHWIVDRKHGSPVISLIIYFDFKEEKFKEVVLPHGSSTYGELVLGVMRGCLCVTRKNDESHEIWLMKDYGTVKESWTKLFVIPQYCDYLKPLCFTEDGKVLLEIRSTEPEEFWRIVIYDPNKSSYESTYENISSEIFMTFRLVAYRESLISPKAHVHGTKQKCW